jgi:hypothetical protein
MVRGIHFGGTEVWSREYTRTQKMHLEKARFAKIFREIVKPGAAFRNVGTGTILTNYAHNVT